MTWYPQAYITNLPMTEMSMRSNPSTNYPGRTYRFYNGKVVYPFGHGLSYTIFTHHIVTAPTLLTVPLDGHRRTITNTTALSGKAIRVTHTRCNNLSLPIQVDIKNVGSRDGTHTLLVYSAPPARNNWAPRKQLVAFEKVHVAAGTQRRVGINVHVCKYLSVVDRVGNRRIVMGEYSLHIGDIKHSVSLQPTVLGVIKS